jgi:3-deoxy-D-manno-octulosonic-acid transferase
VIHFPVVISQAAPYAPAMRWTAALWTYRLLLPVLMAVAAPGWLVKMLRRGGFGTRLGERAAIYTSDREFEPCGATHVHAVSVGETLIALKLIRAWLEREPDRRFVLATGTATGHAVATAASLPALRVTYSPLDMPSMVRRYLNRFEPGQIILVEGEAWPHLLLACRKRCIPVSLVNARMSPRSERRYRKFAPLVAPLFSLLDSIAIQEAGDASVWEALGVDPRRLHLTGSLKFDPGSGAIPAKRQSFQAILDAFGKNRPVILAASTHAGEDAWITTAVCQTLPDALPVMVPRHAERCGDVRAELERAGFKVVLRSAFAHSSPAINPADGPHVFVIDSTGELRDWTAHADLVLIGKSFLATGGQNPAEAILAGKPVVFGPHMENFEPLAGRLVAAGACLRVCDPEGLAAAIHAALADENTVRMTASATRILARHHGATQRVIDLLTRGPASPPATSTRER